MTPLNKDKENKYNKFWLYISFLVIAVLLGYVFTLLYSSDEAVDMDMDVEVPAINYDDNLNGSGFEGPTEHPPGI